MSRGGAAPRRKGVRRERQVAAALGGQRVPLSGAAGGAFRGDIVLPNGWRVEVKARADGFRQLYTWLGTCEMLVVQADRRPPLVVLPLERLQEIWRLGDLGTASTPGITDQ